jgi:hypothetical protein
VTTSAVDPVPPAGAEAREEAPAPGSIARSSAVGPSDEGAAGAGEAVLVVRDGPPADAGAGIVPAGEGGAAAWRAVAGTAGATVVVAAALVAVNGRP